MPKSTNALDLLRRDHARVQSLFRQVTRSQEPEEQRALSQQIVSELETHTGLEEDVFYPFLREATDRPDLAEEASIEHETAKDLLIELREAEPGTPRFVAVLHVLMQYVEHHVQEEEEEIFPIVEKTGVDLEALGLELEERRADMDGEGAGRPRARSRKARGRDAKAKADAGGRREESHEETEARATAAAFDAGVDPELDTTKDDEKYLKDHGEDLSRSSQRAKWIHAVDEHEDHPGQTLVTRNPAVIQQWANERNGTPATSGSGDPENPRVLRFDFGDKKESSLQPVSWDNWLRVFEERQLVFLYQEHMKAGNQSNFFRLDSPEREDG